MPSSWPRLKFLFNLFGNTRNVIHGNSKSAGVVMPENIVHGPETKRFCIPQSPLNFASNVFVTTNSLCVM
jgi:hypothetical protein